MICVSSSPESPGISAIFRLLTCIGTAPIDEMICTDMLGAVLKTGNLTSPCRIRFEVDGPNRTEAVYVYAFSGAGLASKYTADGRGLCALSAAALSPFPVIGAWRCTVALITR